MNKNNYFIFSIIGILIILNVYLLSISDRNGKIETAHINEGYNFYDNKFVTERLNNNSRFLSNRPMVSIQGDTLSFEDHSKIIFRYSIGNCGDCIDAELQAIVNHIESNPKLLTILNFFVFYNNNSSLADDLRKMRKLKLKVPIYFVEKMENVELEKENIPYYFTIGEDSRLRDFFIPLSGRPYLTQAYLDSYIR
ncbi:MAG: hypothetical protein KAH17_09980 [Bacteroidales bacterium]|nr:hypothetical protein [Bacteroidales bacterium]